MINQKSTAALILGTLAAGLIGTVTTNSVANAATDILVKVAAPKADVIVNQFKSQGAKVETLMRMADRKNIWFQVKAPTASDKFFTLAKVRGMNGVVAAQPNYKIEMQRNPMLKDPAFLAKLEKFARNQGLLGAAAAPAPAPTKPNPPSAADNPAIPGITSASGTGSDPDFQKQWGMNDNNIKAGWKGNEGDGIIVSVIDSGVDYTHEDLVDNIWHNQGEMGTDASGRDRATNGIDDDGNGYIDDVIGWDFVTNDNKPYDWAYNDIELLMLTLQQQGGNPGHGTHCAGNVGARADNGKGIAGVAPKVKIMPIRFLSEVGSGDTAGGVKAILYSVQMGARVSSNSWGSSGEDPNDPTGNQALKDAIDQARLNGQIFVAAAGNGDEKGQGYDNDSSKVPAYPASYNHDNMISVAALDSSDALGSFSNWGKVSVDIGAPGVKVYSTTFGSTYADSLLFGMATWDGTSMATPHVAGAAALYWADHRDATWEQVKAKIMSTAKPISALSGKVVTGGKLSVENLMK